MAAAELNNTVLKDNTNLKAYYRFESGNLTTDSSGQGKTLTNNNTVGEATGVYGGAAYFGTGNTNKYFSVTNDMGIQGGAGSINCWIKTPTTTSASDHESFVGVGDAGTQTELVIFLGGTGIGCARLKSAVAWQNTAESAISANTWYMVTLTYDGTTLRSYINGSHFASVAASGSGSGTDEIDQLSIGRRTNPTSVTYADGAIDDVAIFNTALSADQIKELYEGRFIGETYPQSGLVAGYHLSGETDFSGNNYHLTNTNTVGFVAGKFGNCADFGTANTNKRLEINSNLGIDGGAITESIWIKNRTEISTGSYDYIAQNGETTDVGYVIRYDYNGGTRQLLFWRVRNNVAIDGGGYTVTLGTANWHHIVLTYDATNLKGYLNGNLIYTSGALSGNGSGTTGNTFRIGGNSAYSSAYIDEALVFNRALTSQEIRRMYAVGVGKLQ